MILRLAIVSLSLLFITAFPSSGQLVVSGHNESAQQLAERLAGPNINVFNASITGVATQSGFFEFTGSVFEINSGVLLTSGNIFGAKGPNYTGVYSVNNKQPGTSQMTSLAGTATYDAVTLQFDFEVQSTAIRFDYIFGSEEYNEYVGSQFNDVFAFFISGPGIDGEENIALVPDTEVFVAINNINNGSFWQYYRDNTADIENIQYDGFTTLLTAKKEGLQPCNVYTLKLVIADAGDYIFDSGVFLRESSLLQESVTAITQSVNGDGIGLEGCVSPSFTFNLDQPQPDNTTIPYQIGGTAINGVDYEKIDTAIVIPEGQTSATIYIDPISDGIPESQETVELYFKPEPCQPVDTVTLYINDNQPIEFNLSKTDLTCHGDSTGQINATITGGFAPYTITLNGDQVFNSLPITDLPAGTYQVKVDDAYGCNGEAQVFGGIYDTGPTFLPDGNGNIYTTSININGFNPTETLVSVQQLQSVCLNMEHSFIGDVEMKLIAPNGSEITLKERPGGTRTNFGEPVAKGPVDGANSDLTAGNGYQYCFAHDPVYNTMVDESNNYTYTYTDNSNNTYTDKYLPAGSYTPYESFNGLLGTTLNGTWTIWIKDHKPQDNGYIFNWSISLTTENSGDEIIINEPNPININGVIAQPDCGNSDGNIDISVSGDYPPFDFVWSNGATTEDISGLTAGFYNVNITDQNGCSRDSTFSVSNNSGIIVDAVVTDVSCYGGSDGTIELTVSGGSGDYNFLWSNGSTSPDQSGLTSGDYSISLTDNVTGCIILNTYELAHPAPIELSGMVTNEQCGDREGIIELNVKGGEGSYSYAWSNGDTTSIITDLQAGSYTVNVIDGNGCTASETFTVLNEVGDCIPDCDLTVAPVAIINETCGQSDGSISLNISTSNGPYLVSWSDGSATEDLNGLAAGIYSVTVTDKEGCTISASYEIINNTGSLNFGIPVISSEYCGNGEGAINISVTGGITPYSYLWSNGETTEDLFDLSAGDYHVVLTDAAGCSIIGNFSVQNEAGDLIQTYGNVVDEVCGSGNGSIDIIIEGGAQPYTYLWSNGDTSEDLKDITSGIYQCTITDLLGCSIQTPEYSVLNQAGTLVIDFIDIDHERCSNGSGQIELFISGGVVPYNFTWSDGTTGTSVLSNLNSGIYSCLVTDQNGCFINTGPIQINNESGDLSVDGIFVQDELCGDGQGSVDLVLTGGTGVVSFDWSNGETTQDISGLSAGIYSCVISDEAGCSVNISVPVENSPGTLSVEDVMVIDDQCGTGSGSIDLNITGGTTPYNFLWSNGSTTEDLDNLLPGSYGCTITDADGCEVTTTAVVNGSGIIINSIDMTPVNCGDDNGSVSLDISGGSGSYSYQWSNGENGSKISNLGEGIFSCEITDGTGCSITTPDIEVTGNTGSFTLDQVTTIDSVCNTGFIDLTISGGTGPFTYQWSNGETTQDIIVNNSGTYSCTITDADGLCKSTSMDVVISGSVLNASVYTSVPENCGGRIIIHPYGGTPPYTYNWSNGGTKYYLVNLTDGIYSCVITDAVGCTKVVTETISGATPLEASIVTMDDNCGIGEGEVHVTTNFEVLAIRLFDSDTNLVESNSAGIFTNLYPDDYIVSVSKSGCSLVELISINGPEPFLIEEDLITHDLCGNNEGTIDLTVTGGDEPLNFSWSNGSTTEDLDNLAGGTYEITITDAAGCQILKSYDVMGPPTPFSIDNVSTISESCGDGTGSVDLTISGGTLPYTFEWSNGATTEDLTGLSAGTYTCLITDGLGCSEEITAIVTDDVINIDNVLIQQDNCNEGVGSIDLSVTSSAPPVNYQWSNGATTEDIGNLFPGTYAVDISDASGCVVNKVYEILSDLPEINAVVVDDLCLEENGSIDINLTGGMPPFTYSWSNGFTNEDLTGVFPGNYLLTITDVNGCELMEDYTINGPSIPLTIENIDTIPDSCSGSLGGVNLDIIGGTLPYSFQWSNGATTEDLTGVVSGLYSCEITDAAGCTEMVTVMVPDQAIIIDNAIIENDFCNAGNGSIDLEVIADNPPLEYSWSNGATSERIENLYPGSYTVEIMDASACTINLSFDISGNEALNASAVIVNDDCGLGEGAIDITIEGGVGPYQYQWSNGSEIEDPDNLIPGDYEITVTDVNGCSLNASFTVEGTSTPLAVTKLETISETCSEQNGEIHLNVEGGSGNFSYLWSNGATTKDLVGLASGNYECQITDESFGCTIIATTEVSYSDEDLMIELDAIVHDVCNSGSGQIKITINGGDGNYQYQWSNGSDTEDIGGLSAGIYSLEVIDGNNCRSTDEFLVKDITTLALLESNVKNASCEFCQDGGIDITLNTIQDLHVEWSNGATTEDLINVSAGFYSVMVKDLNGCMVQSEFQVGSDHNVNPEDLFVIYPNPSSDEIIIQNKGMVNINFIKLYSSVGKLVYERYISENKESYYFSNLKDLGKGIYSMLIHGDKFSYYHKVVIE